MRLLHIVFFFLVFTPVVFANYNWVYTSKTALFVVEVSETARVIRFDKPSIEFAKGILDFYPRDDARQSVETLITFPESEKFADSLVYEWKRPEEEELSFSLYSHVSTKDNLIKVTKKIDFPLLFVPPELEVYTQPTLKIDSGSEGIAKLANELAEGEDDYYGLVFKLADWVHGNIQYLSTKDTADFAQKASWVLENRIGACDELTTLFVALARSLGIPAKYVSGFAYGKNGPGPHAWAEVYFPDFGWLPFDITSSEFGYVDVSHIKLKESVDADVPSSRYEWKSIDVELDASKLEISTEVLAAKGTIAPLLNFSLHPYAREIGLDSYNYVETKIKNGNPFYVPAHLEIGFPEEIIAYPKEQNVLLRPYEEQSIYWILHLKDLPSDYSYNLPFVMYSYANQTVGTFLVADQQNPTYDKVAIEQMVAQKQKIANRVYKTRLLMECTPRYKEFYPDENIEVDCFVMNTGNAALSNVYICHESTCQNIDLGVAKKAKTSFSGPNTGEGHSLLFTAKASQISANDTVNTVVVDKPKISIGDIEYPSTVSFDQDYFIKFGIGKESADSPRQVLVILNSEELAKSWDFKVLNATEDLVAEMKGRTLRDGQNPLKIFVSYYDGHGRRYETEKSMIIQLEHVSIADRIIMWYDSFGGWLSRIF